MKAEDIKKQMIEAMKVKDTIRVSTLRLLLSSLQNIRIDKKEDLTEKEVLEVIRVEAKKRRDAIEAYKKAGRSESAEAEKRELKILEEYLPTNLTEAEINLLVDEAIKNTNPQGPADFGRVMGQVMGKTKGRADGNIVKSLVERKLQTKVS